MIVIASSLSHLFGPLGPQLEPRVDPSLRSTRKPRRALGTAVSGPGCRCTLEPGSQGAPRWSWVSLPAVEPGSQGAPQVSHWWSWVLRRRRTEKPRHTLGKPGAALAVAWGHQGEPPGQPLVALAIAPGSQDEPWGQPLVSLLPISSLWAQHLNHYRVAQVQPLVVVRVIASLLPAKGSLGLGVSLHPGPQRHGTYARGTHKDKQAIHKHKLNKHLAWGSTGRKEGKIRLQVCILPSEEGKEVGMLNQCLKIR